MDIRYMYDISEISLPIYLSVSEIYHIYIHQISKQIGSEGLGWGQTYFGRSLDLGEVSAKCSVGGVRGLGWWIWDNIKHLQGICEIANFCPWFGLKLMSWTVDSTKSRPPSSSLLCLDGAWIILSSVIICWQWEMWYKRQKKNILFSKFFCLFL